MQCFIVSALVLFLVAACEENSHDSKEDKPSPSSDPEDDKNTPSKPATEKWSKPKTSIFENDKPPKPRTDTTKVPPKDLIERMTSQGFKIDPSLEEDLRLWEKSDEERNSLLEKKALALEEVGAKNKDATALSELAYIRILQAEKNKAQEAIKDAINLNSKAVRNFFAREELKHGLIAQLKQQLDLNRSTPEKSALHIIISDYSLDQGAAIGSFRGIASFFSSLKGESFP